MRTARQARRAILCEALEGRTLFSTPSFSYDIIAKTGQSAGGALTGFGTGPSINNSGLVAFVGKHAKGDGLFVGSGTAASLKDIGAEFDNDSTRSFGQAVQINDIGQVVAEERVVGSSSLKTFIQVYQSSTVNSFTTAATADSSGLGNFNAVFAYPAINHSGQTAFGALDHSGTRLLADTAGSSFIESAISGVLSPDIADNGNIVVRAGALTTSSIVLFSHALKPTAIATSAKFSALGATPAVSHDGLLVSFYGVLTAAGASSLNAAQKGWPALSAGPGIFVSIQTSKGPIVQRVAGLGSGSPFTAFSADTRVAVTNLSFTDSAASVAFLATGTDGKQGLYVSRLLLNNGAGTIPAGPQVVATTSRVLRNSLVVEVGQTVPGVSGTVNAIGINDPINSAQSGQLAFYIGTTAGAQAIVRATPAAPKVVLTEATTLDAKSIAVTFTVSNLPINAPLTFDIYRSDATTKDASSILIGTETLATSNAADAIGTHTITLINGTHLTPNTLKPYIVVVADADGSLLEAAGSQNDAYFRTWQLGVLAHGYQAPPPFDDGTGATGSVPPAWEPVMAADLIKYDHYDQVYQDNWVTYSRLTIPDPKYGSWATHAGFDLEAAVVKNADTLAAKHKGDVVNVHFIGHSRGTVVVTQAQKYLAGTMDPALEGSFIEMTLLDPHPANTAGAKLYASLQSLNILEKTLAKTIEAAVVGLTVLCNDPVVTVGASASATDVYYQQTANNKGFYNPTTKTYTDQIEYYLNLWGEGPNNGIINNSASPIKFTNLTNVVDPSLGHKKTTIGLIGHAQVVDWYLVHVVDKGLLTT